MITNPIQYTSRTFLTALSDINSDPMLVDKPDWFKRLIAGMVDVASVWNNAEANNGYLRTAITRRAVTDLCALIDYSLAPKTTASGGMLFDASPTAIMPFTVTAVNLKANGPSGISSSALRYGARAPLTFTARSLVIAQTTFDPVTGIWLAANTFILGEKVWVSSDGTLPDCFSAGTDYYIIPFTGGVAGFVVAKTRALGLASILIKGISQGSGNITFTRLSMPAVVYQQDDATEYSIGTSDGITEWQEFDIGQTGVLPDTLTVRIGADYYTQVTTLALSGALDKHYRIYLNTDESTTIRFGDGSNGFIPSSGEVYVGYKYGGGSISNVSVLNQIISYAGGDSNIVGCFNYETMINGTDAESLETAKKRAPMLLKSRNRFITTDDGVALVLAYGGIATATINKNVYGILSSQVLGVALGGGNPAPAVRTAIAAYLISLSPLESIYVQFDAATLTPFLISMDVLLVAGFSWSVIESYVSIAIRLYISETGREILDIYEADGISAAVQRINTIFTTGFGSADFYVIQAILDALTRIGAMEFGATLHVSDLYSICSVIAGVDAITLTGSTPALPYQCANVEIPTHTGSTITLTQVSP